MDEFLIPNANYERLLADYRKYGSLHIAFDFDSTVYDYHGKGKTYNMVIQLIRNLKSINCALTCWTAQKDVAFVIDFLERNDIPFDDVNGHGIPLPWESKKPFFSATLDDRCGLIQVYTELTQLVNTIKNEK